jgi:glucose-1-phosphate thymidylyltransferase
MGIASALKLARDFTGTEPFAVILGDNFFEDEFSREFEDFSSAGREQAGIFLKPVEDPERFGVYHEGVIEEKPKHPRSNMAVTGLYLYHEGVYDMTEKLIPSGRGELEITDINREYCERKSIRISQVGGFWSDMGTPSSMARTQEFVQSSNHSVCAPSRL